MWTLLVGAAWAATICTWTDKARNDGVISVSVHEDDPPLVTLDAGVSHVGPDGKVQTTYARPHATKLRLRSNGVAEVEAWDESAYISGQVAPPLRALHLREPQTFGGVWEVDGDDLVEVVGRDRHDVLVAPWTPDWFSPLTSLARPQACEDLALSVTGPPIVPDRPGVPRPLRHGVEAPVRATPDGAAVGLVRCPADQAVTCPSFSLLERANGLVRVVAETQQGTFRAWIPAAALDDGTGAPAAGLDATISGNGAYKPRLVKCPASMLSVRKGSRTEPAVLLSHGVAVRIVSEGEGWALVELPEARWMTPLSGRFALSSGQASYCTPG